MVCGSCALCIDLNNGHDNHLCSLCMYKENNKINHAICCDCCLFRNCRFEKEIKNVIVKEV
jgi:hypothetical protein